VTADVSESRGHGIVQRGPLTGRLRDGLVLLFPGLGLAAGTLILFEMNAAFDHKALPIYEAELAESDPA
jgi:hypothetical protein